MVRCIYFYGRIPISFRLPAGILIIHLSYLIIHYNNSKLLSRVRMNLLGVQCANLYIYRICKIVYVKGGKYFGLTSMYSYLNHI